MWGALEADIPAGEHSVGSVGRTAAEAETPILWPPGAKSWLIGKDPDAGKDWRQEDKGMTEDEMVGWHHNSMGMSLSKLRELVMDREAWRAAAHGVGHDWVTELNWSIGRVGAGEIDFQSLFKTLEVGDGQGRPGRRGS